MKYLYKFGYNTCEESASFECWHDKKFTKKQIEAITLKGYAHVCEAHRKTKDWRKWDHCRTFQHNFENFTKWLKTQGFEPCKFTQECSVFGGAQIDKPGDWSDYCDDLTEKIQKHCVKEFGASPPMKGRILKHAPGLGILEGTPIQEEPFSMDEYP